MDLSIPRGDTRQWSLALTQKDAAGAVVALDLTGKTLRFAARRTPDASGAALIAKSSGTPGEITVTDAPAGECDLFLVPGDTSALPNRRQVLAWDLQVEDGANRYTALSGRLEISTEVTTG